jgi:cardiolipin synthase
VLSVIQPLWLAWIVASLSALASLAASLHVILNKRDERAALGWVGIIWLAPIVGPTLYLLFGINRIRRRAQRLRGAPVRELPAAVPPETLDLEPVPPPAPPVDGALEPLARCLDRVSRFDRVGGNAFEPLIDGDEAYPAMLSAIASAERSIALMTYIFDRDPIGERFIAALGDAVDRGVDVCVIVDDAGLRYSWRTVLSPLRRRGVRVSRFMPAFFSRMPYVNLRTHRKVLVVDGALGFTGGINIRQDHLVKQKPDYPVRDLQFRVRGPVVQQLLEVFVEDWRFSTGEVLTGDAWATSSEPGGDAVARTIPDGPDEDHDRLRWAYLSGLAAARRSVRILTPYFLPDQSLTEALSVASRRGVRVDVVIPYRCNLFFVQWAVWGQLLPVLETCRVWLSPAPFDHSKLMVVDDAWVLLGSGNWDPRSYRLNFELCVEVYDAELGRALAEEVDGRIRASKLATPRGWHRRSLPVRVRDGVARLFAPYL